MDDKNTEARIRATKAASHNVRTLLQNVIAAGLDEKLIDKVRALSLEISAELDERTGGDE